MPIVRAVHQSRKEQREREWAGFDTLAVHGSSAGTMLVCKRVSFTIAGTRGYLRPRLARSGSRQRRRAALRGREGRNRPAPVKIRAGSSRCPDSSPAPTAARAGPIPASLMHLSWEPGLGQRPARDHAMSRSRCRRRTSPPRRWYPRSRRGRRESDCRPDGSKLAGCGGYACDGSTQVRGSCTAASAPVVRSETYSWRKPPTTRDHPIAARRDETRVRGQAPGDRRPDAPFDSCSCPERRIGLSGPDPVAATSPSGRCSTGLTQRPARSTAQVGLLKPAGTPLPFRTGRTAVCTPYFQAAGADRNHSCPGDDAGRGGSGGNEESAPASHAVGAARPRCR